MYPVEASAVLETGVLLPEGLCIGKWAVETRFLPEEDNAHLVVVFTGNVEYRLLDGAWLRSRSPEGVLLDDNSCCPWRSWDYPSGDYMEIVHSCCDKGTRGSVLEEKFLMWVNCELLSSTLRALGLKAGWCGEVSVVPQGVQVHL